MTHKLKQQTQRYRYTWSNRAPNRRARKFLLNYLRFTRYNYRSAALRASLGLLVWATTVSFHTEDRIAHRASCFLTGRGRGSSKRYTISRVRLKQVSGRGQLFGLRKSSW